MEFSSAIYGDIAFLILLCYYLLWSRNAKPKTKKHKAPPEAGGALLLTGHLHLMSGGSAADQQLPHFKLGALADIYGFVFTIRLGVHRALVVSSSDVAKELFTAWRRRRRRLVPSPDPGVPAPELRLRSPRHVLARAAQDLSVELLSSRRVELQSHVRVLEMVQSISELSKLWEEKRHGMGHALVDMKQWFGDLNLNVIVRLVAGKRFYSGGGGGDAAETRRYREFFHLAGLFVADAQPYLGWLDLGGHEKRMKQIARVMNEIIGGWVAEHRKREYSGEDKRRDFMDLMLSVVEGANLQVQFDDDTIIKATCEAFEVSTLSDEMVDMTENAGLMNIKATPLDVFIAPRLSPNLY